MHYGVPVLAYVIRGAVVSTAVCVKSVFMITVLAVLFNNSHADPSAWWQWGHSDIRTTGTNFSQTHSAAEVARSNLRVDDCWKKWLKLLLNFLGLEQNATQVALSNLEMIRLHRSQVFRCLQMILCKALHGALDGLVTGRFWHFYVCYILKCTTWKTTALQENICTLMLETT